MNVRKRKRNAFDFKNRPFTWWIDNGLWLHVYSDDKNFVIKYLLCGALDQPDMVTVIGQEFPGLVTKMRPTNVLIPEILWGNPDSFGGFINNLLEWAFSDQEKSFTEEQRDFAW